MAEEEYVRVRFRVAVNTELGDTVHILGDQELGCWDKNKSVVLVTTPASYPIWQTPRPLRLQKGVRLRYRYAIYNAGKFQNWANNTTENSGYHHLTPTLSFDINDPILSFNKDYDMTVQDTNLLVATMEQNDGNSTAGDAGGSNDDALQNTITRNSPTTLISEFVRENDKVNNIDEEDDDYEIGLNEDLTSRELRRHKTGSVNTTAKRVFLVTYNLPLVIRYTVKGKWDVTWDLDQLSARSENSIADKMDTLWIGVVTGVFVESTKKNLRTDDLTDEQRKTLTEKLKSMDCYAVFVGSKVHEDFNVGFCKSVLWPMLHNAQALTHLNEQMRDYKKYWLGYQRVNELIAARVANLYKEGDFIWINDYHLSLLPRALRTRLREESVTIVIFFHVPFPTSEVFRSLPTRTEMLQGILAANVVGFHTFSHARHFLTACARFVGVGSQSQMGDLCINYEGRSVMVCTNHVGIESAMIMRESKSKPVVAKAKELRAKHNGRTLFASFEYLQRLNGVALTLLAYEIFLQTYPRQRSKVCLVMRCAEIDERKHDSDKTKGECEELVARIKKQFGEEVIDYESFSTGINGWQFDFTRNDRLALWVASKVLIKTSVQEGLNMTPLEFVLVKEPPNEGIVVLSEFTTACAVLNGAIRINPWDVKTVADTLYQAYQAGNVECRKRRARDVEYISMLPSSEWTNRILLDAERTKRSTDATDMEELRPGQRRVLRRGVMKLDAASVKRSIASAKDEGRPCVYLFDYGGTLIQRENSNKQNKQQFFGVTRRAPSEMTKRWLRELCSNPMNAVFVVSGASTKVLNKNFGEISRLGLAAENGMYFSWNSSNASKTRLERNFNEEPDDDNQANQPFAPQMVRRNFSKHVRKYKDLDVTIGGRFGRQWAGLANTNDSNDWLEWKATAIPILQNYTSRCAGSRLRTSENHLSWDFRLADPEWAKINAKHLKTELEEALAEHDVTIEVWKGSVNVIPSGMTKGLVVEHILEEVQNIYGRRAGMIFCIGDDLADESMFEVSLEYESEKLKQRNRNDTKRVFTCCVGKKPSRGEYYVNNVDDVQNLLRDLVQGSGIDLQGYF